MDAMPTAVSRKNGVISKATEVSKVMTK